MARKHHFAAYAFLLLAGTELPVLAGPIDVSQAQQNAEQFRLSLMPRNGMHKAAGVTTPMEHVYTYNDADGQPALYVFNTNSQGYVIASANDDAMSILGYSTEGSFDPENIPDGMRYMFDLYAEEIGSLSAAHATSQKGPKKAETTMPYTVRVTEPIEPLLDTRWGQLQPYNRYCPFMVEMSDNGAASATGCMTTALAQIMRYHKWPLRGQGSTFMKVRRGLAYDDTVIKYYDHTYDWDVMYAHRNDYPYTISSDGKRRIYSTNETSVHNVSQLMFDLGVALRTEYGSSSGAATIRILPALLNHFDYDPGMRLIRRSDLSSFEEWNDIVIEELQAKRPVYLDGINDDRTIGHAFVCDGYDGNGFFHINWGWDGTSNDYFLTTALNPTSQGVGGGNSGYSNSLILLRGMKPNETGVTFNPYIACTDRKPIAERPGYLPAWGIWVENPGEGRELGLIEEYEITNGQWFAASLSTGYNMDVYGKLGIYVVKPDGSSEVAWHNSGELVQMLSGNGFEYFHVDVKESWKHDGVRAFYVYKPEDKDEIRYIYNHDGQICSFSFQERGDKVYAVIDRTKVDGGTATITPPTIEQTPSFFDNGLCFDYNTNATRLSDRAIGTIGIQVEGGRNMVYDVDPNKVYRNMTDDAVFTVPAGANITPSITWEKGSWMHGYFYIDRNGDGTLSCNPNQFNQDGTDVASFSYWTGDVTNGEGGKNSLGVTSSNNSLVMPACKAPETPGTYYVRFKIDWNCIDPRGNAGYTKNNQFQNYIVSNGGYIVDAKLIVTGEPTVTPEPIDPVDPEEPDEPIDPALLSSQLANIYVGAGTSALELFPTFDPAHHIYLAHTSSNCALADSQTYTIFGSPADSKASASAPIMLKPTTGWNRATITCTAPDGTTKQDYHVILLTGDGNNSADPATKALSVIDLSLMLHMLGPDFGYKEANPADYMFDRLVNLEQVNTLVNLLLKK